MASLMAAAAAAAAQCDMIYATKWKAAAAMVCKAGRKFAIESAFLELVQHCGLVQNIALSPLIQVGNM